MAKKVSRKSLVEKLDKVFSIYIRRKDAINDIAQCVTCGKKDHWSKLQNGHYMSRRHYSTRWDELNCAVQCMGCNVFRAGEIYLYTKYLCLKYGDNFPDELYAKSQTIRKFDDVELQDMIAHYTELNKSFL
jgi:hypothetical protein